MKKQIVLQILSLLGFLICSLGANAQEAYVHLNNTSFNSYVDLGFDFKSDLMDKGNDGEATLEFWINSTDPETNWILTDFNKNSENLRIFIERTDHLIIEFENQRKADIHLSDLIFPGDWHHLALTFHKANDTRFDMEVYVNGTYQSTIGLDSKGFDKTRTFYFYKSAVYELLLTEIRAWSVHRSAHEIETEFYQTYAGASQELIEQYKREGLEIYYYSDDPSTLKNQSDLQGLPITQATWQDAIGGKELSFIDSYGIATLGEVKSFSDHPQPDIEDAIVDIQEGEADDEYTSEGKNIVRVSVGYDYFEYRENGDRPGSCNRHRSKNATHSWSSLLRLNAYQGNMSNLKNGISMRNEGDYLEWVKSPYQVIFNPERNPTYLMNLSTKGLGINLGPENTASEALHVDGSIEASRYHLFASSAEDRDGKALIKPISSNSNADVGVRFFVKKAGDRQVVMSLSTSGLVSIGRSELDIKGNSSVKLAVDGNLDIFDVSSPTSTNAPTFHQEGSSTLDWPDFVFSESYENKTLVELEKYISVNKHLPGVPSVQDVIEQGIDIHEMNAILLQKIEELTLHLINQDKRIDALLSKQ